MQVAQAVPFLGLDRLYRTIVSSNTFRVQVFPNDSGNQSGIALRPRVEALVGERSGLTRR